MAQDPSKPQGADDRERISQPMDDLSEEATIMLDPAALQRQLQAEMANMPQGSAAGQTRPPGGGAPSSSQPVGFDAPPPPPPPPGGMPPPPAASMATMGSGGDRPNTTLYLVLSILATLCCCLPLGVAGIVFSALAIGDVNRGDFAAAEEKLKKTKLILIIGVVLGLLINVAYLVITVAANS